MRETLEQYTNRLMDKAKEQRANFEKLPEKDKLNQIFYFVQMLYMAYLVGEEAKYMAGEEIVKLRKN